ncbi:MAG TPA: DUF2975 domain-containing protein [Nocardioides sp.]|nr:DUF2975 domain-containing protein [Nocardioides sp.]
MATSTRLDTYLRWLRATATFVFIAALCVAVALVVIALVPGSPVRQALPARALSGFDGVGGVEPGVSLAKAGWVPFAVDDPSLGQRLLFLLTVLPGLLVIAEVARRLASVVRTAQENDPFTAATSKALVSIGRLTVLAGLGAWAVSQVAGAVLAHTMLESSTSLRPHHSPLGWLVVGLILTGFGLILDRGVEMRDELDTVI